MLLRHCRLFRLTGLAFSNPVILKRCSSAIPHTISQGARMRDAYEVLRQKELELSRLQKEVEALRIAAPLVSDDGEVENDNVLTLPRAVNDTPEPDQTSPQDRPKKRFWR